MMVLIVLFAFFALFSNQALFPIDHTESKYDGVYTANSSDVESEKKPGLCAGIWEMDEYRNLARYEYPFTRYDDHRSLLTTMFDAVDEAFAQLRSDIEFITIRFVESYGRQRWERFVDEIDSVDRSLPEIKRGEAVYKICQEYIPQYASILSKKKDAVVPDNSWTNLVNGVPSSVIAGAGVCRDMSRTLVWALNRVGVNAYTMGNIDHKWVNVRLKNPPDGYRGDFDLDPTWYGVFTPLEPRYKY